MLRELLEQIACDQAIAIVSADGAFDTRACHEAIAAHDACAVIPARSNAQAWSESSSGLAARKEIVCSRRQLSRAIWKRGSGYHQRSFVETKMHCFKLLGDLISARDFDRQVGAITFARLSSTHCLRSVGPKLSVSRDRCLQRQLLPCGRFAHQSPGRSPASRPAGIKCFCLRGATHGPIGKGDAAQANGWFQ